MIEFRNVSKIYRPNSKAIEDVTFHVKPGEFVSLVGQSGAGKSTIVKLMIAELKPTKGRIIIGGWDITHIRNSEVPILRRQIGVVFQDFKLLPNKTAGENIAFALEVCGEKLSVIKDTVSQLLKIVGLEGKEDRFPKQLSGGEQQRVSVARALAHRPKILIADEPTGNLDSLNTKDIIDLLLKINTLGTTVLLVTHNKEVVNSLKKRVIAIENAHIISDKEKGRYLL